MQTTLGLLPSHILVGFPDHVLCMFYSDKFQITLPEVGMRLALVLSPTFWCLLLAGCRLEQVSACVLRSLRTKIKLRLGDAVKQRTDVAM